MVSPAHLHPWSASFRVEVHPKRDRVRIAPVGELDLATARPLEDKLCELEESGFEQLVLDLRRLTFIDCAGLRVLLMAHTRARQAGRELTVLCGPGQVRRLLALTGIDQQLDIIAHPVTVAPPTRIKRGST